MQTQRAPRPAADPEMAQLVEELRLNFDRALRLDVQEVRERIDKLDVVCARLEEQVGELRSTVSLLRTIAGEHEERLKVIEQQGRTPAPRGPTP